MIAFAFDNEDALRELEKPGAILIFGQDAYRELLASAKVEKVEIVQGVFQRCPIDGVPVHVVTHVDGIFVTNDKQWRQRIEALSKAEV